MYVCDGRALGTFFLPESFTDRADPPAATPLTVVVLTALTAIVSALQKSCC